MNEIIKIAKRLVYVVTLLLLIVSVPSIFYPKYRQMCGLIEKRDELKYKVQYKQQRIQDIRMRQQLLVTDPEYVERIAHENRRIRPNEIVFIFDSDK
jgi:hypothetical protein